MRSAPATVKRMRCFAALSMTRAGVMFVISGTLHSMTARPLTEETGRRAWRAAAVFLAVAAAIALTARGPGLTMDEPFYIGRALNYTGWFAGLSARSFTWPVIREHWGYADHPPLGSLWIALNMRLFGGAVDLLDRGADRRGDAVRRRGGGDLPLDRLEARRARRDSSRRWFSS